MPLTKETVGKMIDAIEVSIISSIDENGFPNTKAMLPPRKREDLKYFYFSTNTSSSRIKQYSLNNKACIYFFDRANFIGAMFTGKMQILSDQKVKEEIWREGDELFYPLGVADPDYSVLKFTADRIRIYENLNSFEINLSDTAKE